MDTAYSYCLFLTYFRIAYIMSLVDEDFYVFGPEHDGWFHIVVNFIGPSVTQGFRVYNDGVQVGGNSRVERGLIHAEGDGRIMFGRFYTDVNERYASAHMDELLLFNQVLTEAEISKLGQIST